jgi:hypothetical protein
MSEPIKWTCRDCGERKSPREFYTGNNTYCKDCFKRRSKWGKAKKRAEAIILDRYNRLQELKLEFVDIPIPTDMLERKLDREDDKIRLELREKFPNRANEIHDDWPFKQGKPGEPEYEVEFLGPPLPDDDSSPARDDDSNVAG